MNQVNWRWSMVFACGVACAIGAAACGGDGEGQGGGGSGGGTGTTSTSSSTSSTTGTGGQGTGGGVACLAPSAYADLFAIADPALCAVAIYTANEPIGFQVPTWGSHGGPLLSAPDDAGGGVTITRWALPAGTTGALTGTTAHVDAKIPLGAFAGGQVIDTPFFGWTVMGWAGGFPDTEGKLLTVKGTAIDASFDVNGVYGLAAVGGATSGRVLFTALSPLGSVASGMNGLYAADACDTPKPDLGAGQGCEGSKLIAAWGDSSGPVAVDRAGNAFSVQASFATGDQEARGFAAAEIAKGAKATAGATLFTLDGFGSALAAITPSGGDPGLLVFQPFDATAKPLDVIAQKYTAGATVAAQGTPAPLLTVPAAMPASFSLMTDDEDRLWVAASGDQSTTFVVLARAK